MVELSDTKVRTQPAQIERLEQKAAEQAAWELVDSARKLADELAARPNLGLNTAPERELERFAELGLMMAPVPRSLGGLGLGSEPGTQAALMRLLAITGGADLALGRIYEGHVNGVLLTARYGSFAQLKALADDCREGALSGVWNTGAAELLRLHPEGERFRFEGVKTFATGAGFVRRPIVTAELDGRGWQMTLPRMETLGATLDRSFWHPLGMESSESFEVDFTGGLVGDEDLIGEPGDFYRDPMFRGGAIRFAAVQAGAVLRLHGMFTEWLEARGRGDDPYQVARLGEVSILAQECALWVEKAAAVAEESFYGTEKQHVERMVECANMMRTAIEQKATRVMQLVTAGVGAHGLLQPHRFERVIRDLTMYLRQPAPDQALAAVGRSAMEKHWRRARGPQGGFWSDEGPLESLPASYFQKIYERKRDPWDFETSAYEREKYDATLASLPRRCYASGLEVGCSIGVLTARLAVRCERLLGVDVSERALEQARIRCAGWPQVRFEQMQVPQELPDGEFDLVVVSEVAYYWQRADLERAAEGLAARQGVGGQLLLVHLIEPVVDYPLTGDEVHEYWLSRPEWKPVHAERHERFRLDLLERVGAG